MPEWFPHPFRRLHLGQYDFQSPGHGHPILLQHHLITDEDKNLLKEELFVLIDEMEALAARGKSKAGNDVRIYISNINFEATYSYLRQVPRNSA